MYQPAINSQAQGQLKKTTGRNNNKSVEVTSHAANDKSKKSTQITGASNKLPVRKPVKNYASGRREKSFSKNERKIACSESRNYMEKSSSDINEEIALQTLLNFQYSSGRNVDSSNPRGYQFSRRKKTYFNKEEYLQAKCLFVVIGSADSYAINAVDPDKLVDWDKVHLVYLPSHDPPNCPICLYSPVAAKITRCGHIFCWSCILHYLHLGEKAWRKCPICHEAVHKNDLKSVKSYAQRKFARLDSISMKLMMRAKDSVFVSPICESPSFKFSSWIDQTSNLGSKIMLATPQEVVQYILMKERNELHAQLSSDLAEENGEEAFITIALGILEEEIKSFKLEEISDTGDYTDEREEERDVDALENENTLSAMLNEINVNEREFKAAFSDDEEIEATNNEEEETSLKRVEDDKTDCYFMEGVAENSYSGIPCEQSSFEGTKTNTSWSQSAGSSYDGNQKSNFSVDSYYFYQAEDGQNIFLHSINARCVIEEYGALDAGPLKITGQIIDFECFTMTKELRKRFRYLSHLPLSSEFLICELILKPPLLSKHTIHNFMPEFKNRKATRLRKMKEQQKFDRQANAAESKQHGFRIYDESYDDEDDLGIDLSNTEEFPCSLSPASAGNETKGSKGGCIRDDSGTTHFPGLSFAQMLNKKGDDITTRSIERVPTVDKSFRGNGTLVRLTRDSHMADNEDDGPDIVVPDFKQMFSDAMFASPVQNENLPVVAKRKGGKKKREKGMLLFATAGQRKY